jgi:hypothetical protein
MNPVKVLELTDAQIERALQGPGLGLQIPPFRFLIRSNTGLLSRPLRLLYQDYVKGAAPSQPCPWPMPTPCLSGD